MRYHKATGQAYAVLNGKAVYFGRSDDPQAEQKYHQAIAEWLAAGKQLPVWSEYSAAAQAPQQQSVWRCPDGSTSSCPQAR